MAAKPRMTVSMPRKLHIPPDLGVERIRRSLRASGREDLQIEEPVYGGDSPALHVHATLPRMHGPALVGDEVVEVREPWEERLLATTGMVEPLHREEFPLDDVVGLV